MITLIPSREPNAAQKAQIARKYGMFIHFGINTFNNTEWSDGTLPLDSYAPDAIDTDSWVRHAYEAGMNYVILITKHHDGFCLFDTHTTEYCVNSIIPFGTGTNPATTTMKNTPNICAHI